MYVCMYVGMYRYVCTYVYVRMYSTDQQKGKCNTLGFGM